MNVFVKPDHQERMPELGGNLCSVTAANGSHSLSPRVWTILSVFGLLACLFVLFRPFWLSHFNLVLSDPVDGRFSIGILEHWNRVFHGQSQISSPLFFFPENGVLGYSEAFFLLGVPFSLLRCLGLDRYLAFQITMMLLVGIGFCSMLYLLRRIMALTKTTALIGASLFVSFNMFYIHIVHPQLVAVVFVPLLISLAAVYWRRKDHQPACARVCICALTLLLALLFLTSFYVAWFTFIFSGIVLLFFCLLTAFVSGSTSTIMQEGKKLLDQKWNLLLAAAVFSVAMIPFFSVYLPALHQTGMRSLADTLPYMSPPLAVFDVGPKNLVWGRISSKIEHLASPGGVHEHPAGWPFVTVAFFLFSALYVWTELRQAQESGNSDKRQRLCWITALSFSCVLLWLAGTKFGGHIPVWKLFFKFVPGASAIRVPIRGNLIVNTGIIIVSMFAFDQLLRRTAHCLRNSLPLVVLLAFIFGEQLNAMPTHLINRADEARKFSTLPPPPRNCSAFYVSNWSGDRVRMLTYQTDAILVAETFGVGTIDGYSGWFPKGWDLLNGSRLQMRENVRDWVEEHAIPTLCGLNLETDIWSVADLHTSGDIGHLIDDAIANASFEKDDLAPWRSFQKVQVSRTSAVAHGGHYSVAESVAAGSIYQDISGLEPGKTYTISAWVLGSKDATATAQVAAFDPDTKTATFSRTLPVGPSWRHIAHLYTASAGGKLRLHLFRNDGSGTVYWDDITIYIDN